MSAPKVDPQHYFELGSREHAGGNLANALANYRAAIALSPDLAAAHVGVGAIFHVEGRLEEAAESYSKALEFKPDYAEAHYNLGNALKDLGDPDAAITSYRKAISCRPDFPEACNNLGVVLQTLGRTDEAIRSYRNAIALKPDHVMASFNLGTLLQQRHELDEAIACYRQALSFKPDFPEAFNSLGVALKGKGELTESIAAFQRAAELNPDYAVAHDNLGTAHHAAGQIDAALTSYQRALALSDSAGFKANFVRCVKNCEFRRVDPRIRDVLLEAITEQWGWQSELARAAISVVRCGPEINDCIERAVQAWPRRLDGAELYGPAGIAVVSNDRLLRALLETGPVCDVAMERFLTMARRAMLGASLTDGAGAGFEGDVLAFCCAVARQCFNNEYIYSYDDTEWSQANLLKQRLVDSLGSGVPVPAPWVAAVAAYWPLLSVPMSERVLDLAWPEPVTALLVQQIAEPLEERRYRQEIPRLTDVGADISTSVRQQYEENPYPRWINTPRADDPLPIDDFLARQFAASTYVPLGKRSEVDVLIAGCGTGLEPILRARQLANAKVLAIDLSLSSICYAKRKTRELGLTNIDYAQADITKLHSLGRTFDVVESTGVLHHLADPLEGMRALVPLLRPGGFMYLGLYSELARGTVVAAKEIIAKRGYASTDAGIRQCRQDLLLEEAGGQFEPLKTMRDFHIMSECRDLLFHVQEHRFTLPQVKSMLAEFGLNFIGFSSLDPSVLKEYEARFTDDPTRVNLDYWGYFETEFPATFLQMYQFWAQKPA